MKKRFLLESVTIAGLLVMLMSTAVFAYPEYDADHDSDYGWAGSYIHANVYAEYYPGGNLYNYVEYVGQRGSSGYAETVGNMYYTYWAGTAHKDGSTSGDFAVIEYPESGTGNCDYAAMSVYSEFEFYGEYWSLDAFASVTAS